MRKFLDSIDLSSTSNRIIKTVICFLVGLLPIHSLGLYGKSILLKPQLVAFGTYFALIIISTLFLGLAAVYASSYLRKQLKGIDWRVVLIVILTTSAITINMANNSVRESAVLSIKLEVLEEYQQFAKKYSMQIDGDLESNDTSRIEHLINRIGINGCSISNDLPVGSVQWARYAFNYIDRNCFR